jgi:hypothetical protein
MSFSNSISYVCVPLNLDRARVWAWAGCMHVNGGECFTKITMQIRGFEVDRKRITINLFTNNF